jgi:hypothetical protein
MPINLLKKYPELLELIHLNEADRKESLYRVFKRDIEDNELIAFRIKKIRPIKKEDGEPAMETLYHHLTTRMDESEEGKKERRRLFEMDRSQRLHWILHHLEERKEDDVEVFSYEDRINRKDVIRTYIYDKDEEYVIILEPQRSGMDYYLLTAYHLNEKRGKKQIKQKMKNKLTDIH